MFQFYRIYPPQDNYTCSLSVAYTITFIPLVGIVKYANGSTGNVTVRKESLSSIHIHAYSGERQEGLNCIIVGF